MRLALIIIIIITLLLAVAWIYVFLQESRRTETDYTGLSLILTAILGIVGGGFIGKVIQKKYEKDENTPE